MLDINSNLCVPTSTGTGSPKPSGAKKASSGINSGFLVVGGGPKIDVKKVDAVDVTYGATKAPRLQDTKKDPVKGSMDQIANPPQPRQQMRGQQNSRNYKEDGKAYKNTITPDVGD